MPIDEGRNRSKNRILLAGATMETKERREAAILGIIVQSLIAVQEKRATLSPALFRQMATIRWGELFHGRPGDDGERHAPIEKDAWPEPTLEELTEMADRFNDVYRVIEMA